MALQRSPTNDASHDERTAPPKGKGIREWLRSVASPEVSPTANSDGTPDGAPQGSTNGSTYGQPAVGSYVKPHGELHGPSNGAEQDALFRRVGDSVLLKGSAISPPACPLEASATDLSSGTSRPRGGVGGRTGPRGQHLPDVSPGVGTATVAMAHRRPCAEPHHPQTHQGVRVPGWRM